MTTTDQADPSELSLDELRALREQLQLEDDAVSYARRVAQARLDLITAEVGRRGGAVDEELRVLHAGADRGEEKEPAESLERPAVPLLGAAPATLACFHRQLQEFPHLSRLAPGAPGPRAGASASRYMFLLGHGSIQSVSVQLPGTSQRFEYKAP